MTEEMKTKLEGLLLEGLDSGEPIEITPEYWERKKAELVERHRSGRAISGTDSSCSGRSTAPAMGAVVVAK